MKRILSVPIGILAASAVLTALVSRLFSDTDVPILFVTILGMINAFFLAAGHEKAERYDSLVFRFNLVVAYFLPISNVVASLGAFFVLMFEVLGDLVLISQMKPSVLGFALMISALSILWHISVSKLTPKPGTMVVDDNLYYLRGEALPRKLSPHARVITEKTVIPVFVPALHEGRPITLPMSFRFAPWVFVPENRHHLPGHLYFSDLIRKAERELAAMFSTQEHTGGDAEVSPYIFQHMEK